MAAQREPLDVRLAEGSYDQAMRQAERLGARPLAARCHLGLGSLYRRAGRDGEARRHLARASALFREMRMRLWSDRVEAKVRMVVR